MIETNNNPYMFNSPARPLSMTNNTPNIATPYYAQQTYKSYSPTTPPLVDPWFNTDSEDNRKSKRRKEMNILMKDLNQDYLSKCER